MARTRPDGLVARIRHLAAVEELRASLWFVPALAVVAAAALATVLIRIEIGRNGWLADIVFPGGAESARAILQTIAGSVITVTGVVFSLTVVTLQLASTQFSPRLLRTFLRDVSNQVVLGIFLATFTFCLVVLRAVASGTNGEPDRVPALAITGAYVLTTGSVIALVYFIDHIARAIRIDSLMREVNEDASEVIEHVGSQTPASGAAPAFDPSAPRVAVPARRSGFVQAVDEDALVKAAVDARCTVVLEACIGARVIEAAPVAWLYFDGNDHEASDALKRRVAGAVQLGYERTMQQDVAFGLRQLVDVAVKALSPGVNDPTTAVHAIGHLAHLMVRLSHHELGPRVRTDDAGDVRAVVPGHTFEDFLKLSCGQIRRYGAGEPAVTGELLRLILDVARADHPAAHADAICTETDLIVAAAERHTEEPADLGDLRQIRHEINEVVAAAKGRAGNGAG